MDEQIVLSETNFEYYWTTDLDVYLENYLDLITYTYPHDIVFQVRDYCLGWTMSTANITLSERDSIIWTNEIEPSISITKYILSDTTQFEFSFLNYTQLMGQRVDEGCGKLIYTPHYF